MVDTLMVNLGTRSYPIHFAGDVTGQVAAAVNALRRSGRRCVILTDRNVATSHPAALQAICADEAPLIVAPGEPAKSVGGVGEVWDYLAAQRVDRGGALIAVGGGVIGDLGGFAAASYLRGIAFYQVPTTLLAMVDSSVGGKTGINLGAGKNLVGAFHQPRAVYIGTEWLKTLPAREFAAGMAEVIKYGLLGDEGLYRQLASTPLTAGSPELAAVVRACCAAKAAVVEADEYETAPSGGRALLNLGHTFAHAIERVAGYGTYLHGEAVAIGLAAAARLSERLGLVSAADVASVERTLTAHALPVRLLTALPVADLQSAMQRDKKVRAGRLRFVVLNRIGEAATHETVDTATVAAIWREVGAT